MMSSVHTEAVRSHTTVQPFTSKKEVPMPVMYFAAAPVITSTAPTLLEVAAFLKTVGRIMVSAHTVCVLAGRIRNGA